MTDKKASNAWGEQVGGDHYKDLAIQPMEYSMANKLDPLQHTVIKYVTRFRNKAGIDDLKKAIHSIEMLIEHEEEANVEALIEHETNAAAESGHFEINYNNLNGGECLLSDEERAFFDTPVSDEFLRSMNWRIDNANYDDAVCLISIGVEIDDFNLWGKEGSSIKAQSNGLETKLVDDFNLNYVQLRRIGDYFYRIG